MPSGRTEARQTRCCATQEREKLAYVAQSRWLMEFGTSLEEEFGIDPFTLLVLALTEHSLPLRSLAQLLDKHGRARGDFRERIGLAVVVDPGHQAVEVHLGQNIRIISIPIQA